MAGRPIFLHGVLGKLIWRWRSLRGVIYIALALVVAIALSGMSLIILAIELVREEEEHTGGLTRYRQKFTYEARRSPADAALESRR
jgi:hypothetical protein